MAEPNTTVAVSAVPLITLFIAMFGPAVGPYIMITFGAVCGAFWALASSEAMTRWAAARMAARSILLSVLLTVAISELIAHAFDWHLSELYIVVSIAIAAMGDRWLEIIDALKTAVMTALAGLFKKKDAP